MHMSKFIPMPAARQVAAIHDMYREIYIRKKHRNVLIIFVIDHFGDHIGTYIRKLNSLL